MPGGDAAQAYSAAFAVGAVALAMLGAVLAAILLPMRYRSKERARLYDLLAKAQEHNQPLSPEVVRHITIGPTPTREGDVRRGALLLALAAGLSAPTCVGWYLLGRGVLVLGVVPVSVLAALGVAFLVLGLTRPRSGEA
jgi:hypothetical protein